MEERLIFAANHRPSQQETALSGPIPLGQNFPSQFNPQSGFQSQLSPSQFSRAGVQPEGPNNHQAEMLRVATLQSLHTPTQTETGFSRGLHPEMAPNEFATLQRRRARELDPALARSFDQIHDSTYLGPGNSPEARSFGAELQPLSVEQIRTSLPFREMMQTNPTRAQEAFKAYTGQDLDAIIAQETMTAEQQTKANQDFFRDEYGENFRWTRNPNTGETVLLKRIPSGVTGIEDRWEPADDPLANMMLDPQRMRDANPDYADLIEQDQSDYEMWQRLEALKAQDADIATVQPERGPSRGLIPALREDTPRAWEGFQNILAGAGDQAFAFLHGTQTLPRRMMNRAATTLMGPEAEQFPIGQTYQPFSESLINHRSPIPKELQARQRAMQAR